MPEEPGRPLTVMFGQLGGAFRAWSGLTNLLYLLSSSQARTNRLISNKFRDSMRHGLAAAFAASSVLPASIKFRTAMKGYLT